jgi:hypothetical protein
MTPRFNAGKALAPPVPNRFNGFLLVHAATETVETVRRTGIGRGTPR